MNWYSLEAPKALGGLDFGNIHIKTLGLLPNSGGNLLIALIHPGKGGEKYRWPNKSLSVSKPGLGWPLEGNKNGV